MQNMSLSDLITAIEAEGDPMAAGLLRPWARESRPHDRAAGIGKRIAMYSKPSGVTPE
jgi:hypothetical protein